MVKLFTSDMTVHTSDIRVIDKWHANDILVYRNDIWVTCEYIRMTYKWHTSTYEGYTNGKGAHTIDIRVTQMILRWHINDIKLNTNDIRVPYK